MERGRDEELVKRKTIDDEDTVGKVLFDIEDGDLERLKRMLQAMWNIRKGGGGGEISTVGGEGPVFCQELPER